MMSVPVSPRPVGLAPVAPAILLITSNRLSFLKSKDVVVAVLSMLARS